MSAQANAAQPNFMILYVDSPKASGEFYTALLGRGPVEASPTFVMFALESGLMLGLWSRQGVKPAPSAAAGGSEIGITVDHAAADWRGNVGVVPALIPRTPIDPDHAIAMVCGPEIMMRFAIDALQQRGLALDRIFVSMERNMKCAIGLCGHCQFGPTFVCRDGPVFRFDRIAPFFNIREI